MIAIYHTLYSENKITRLKNREYIKEVILFNNKEDAEKFLKFTKACEQEVEDINCIYIRDKIGIELFFRFMFTVNRPGYDIYLYIDEYTPIDVRHGSAQKDMDELFSCHFRRYKYGLMKCIDGHSGLGLLSLEPSLEVLRSIPFESLEEHVKCANEFISKWKGEINNG